MSQQERNGSRDLTYSSWHRTVGPQFYMADIDALEVRTGNSLKAYERLWYEWRNERSDRCLVAVVEAKARGESMVAWNEWQCSLTTDMARKLGVPALLVIYDRNPATTCDADSISAFEVHNVLSGASVTFDDKHMREFIIRLPRSATDMMPTASKAASAYRS